MFRQLRFARCKTHAWPTRHGSPRRRTGQLGATEAVVRLVRSGYLFKPTYNCPTWLDTAASAFRCKGGLGHCSWEEGVPSSPPTRTGITNLSFCATLSAKIGHHILLSLCFRWECDATSVRHACLSKLSPRVEELAQGSASATLGFVVRENLRSLAKRQFSLHSTCTTEACPSAGEAATKSISEVVATNLLARVREGAHSVSVTEQRPGALLPRSRTDDASGTLFGTRRANSARQFAAEFARLLLFHLQDAKIQKML